MTERKSNLADLKRVTVRVRPEMHEWLTKAAAARGLTMNAMIILALETYYQQQMVLPYMGDIFKEMERQKELDVSPEEIDEFQKSYEEFRQKFEKLNQ